jgi:hypothetical protein
MDRVIQRYIFDFVIIHSLIRRGCWPIDEDCASVCLLVWLYWNLWSGLVEFGGWFSPPLWTLISFLSKKQSPPWMQWIVLNSVPADREKTGGFTRLAWNLLLITRVFSRSGAVVHHARSVCSSLSRASSGRWHFGRSECIFCVPAVSPWPSPCHWEVKSFDRNPFLRMIADPSADRISLMIVIIHAVESPTCSEFISWQDAPINSIHSGLIPFPPGSQREPVCWFNSK